MSTGVKAATEADLFRTASRVAGMSESKTMAVAALTEKLRRSGVDVIDLGAGEPDFPTPENIRRAAYHAMENGHTKYTATGGTAQFKRALCDRFAQDFGVQYEAAEEMAAAGGKQGIFKAVAALIQPGGDVLLAKPYWGTFPEVGTFPGRPPLLIDNE